jgi:activator of HSP90 ATPase
MKGKVEHLQDGKRGSEERMKTNENPVNTLVSPVRRQLLGAGAVLLGGLGLGARLSAQGEGEVSRTSEAIHQEIIFNASRKKVYEALTVASQFQKVIDNSAAMKAMALAKKPAEISRELGGAFSVFGGHIVGRQLELVPGQRIVQAWRVVDWEPGIFSIAHFELVEQAGSTKMVFDHTGFPGCEGVHLAEGWRVNYWQPLAKVLA